MTTEQKPDSMTPEEWEFFKRCADNLKHRQETAAALTLLPKIEEGLIRFIAARTTAGSRCIYFRQGPTVSVLDPKEDETHLRSCLPCRLMNNIKCYEADAARTLDMLALVINAELRGVHALFHTHAWDGETKPIALVFPPKKTRDPN